MGYSQQWNFNLQRELPGRLSVEVAYVGNRGVKLTDGPLGHQLNQLTPEQLALGTQLQQQVPNPFQPFIKTGPLSRPTTTRAQLLRPYPQFLDLYNFRPCVGLVYLSRLYGATGKTFLRGANTAGLLYGRQVDRGYVADGGLPWTCAGASGHLRSTIEPLACRRRISAGDW